MKNNKMTKDQLQQKITELEAMMYQPDFWNDKIRAQEVLREIEELKNKLEGAGTYDKGDATLSIFTGAGGDDAEDFSAMLLHMYQKYCDNQGWNYKISDATPNDIGGYRSVSMEVTGKGVYGILRNESGVHRLVRMSPFNAKGKRNTSFSMVEVLPKFEKTEFEIPESDLEISFSKSGGAGGQNVNKRETAVRITHIPTGASVYATTERSQEANREAGLKLLQAKVWKIEEEKAKAAERGMAVSATTDNEWGSQIRSYTLHPYKLIKDHRTGHETGNVEKVLEDGYLDEFIEAEKEL
jgi:peptide chain release factor 2